MYVLFSHLCEWMSWICVCAQGAVDAWFLFLSFYLVAQCFYHCCCCACVSRWSLTESRVLLFVCYGMSKSMQFVLRPRADRFDFKIKLTLYDACFWCLVIDGCCSNDVCVSSHVMFCSLQMFWWQHVLLFLSFCDDCLCFTWSDLILKSNAIFLSSEVWECCCLIFSFQMLFLCRHSFCCSEWPSVYINTIFWLGVIWVFLCICMILVSFSPFLIDCCVSLDIKLRVVVIVDRTDLIWCMSFESMLR